MIDIEYAELESAAPPLDMLAHYFEAHGWGFERLGDDEIVAKVEGSWTTYQLRALWREEERVLQLIAFPDIRVPQEKRGILYETLSLINEQMWLGHFEMWSSDGTLACRHGALLEEGDGEGGISLAQTETLVEAAIDECERYYPVFQFVLWGDKSPAQALKSALIDTAGEA
ncbi:YbjN domain-containing protein [Pacificimonas sp. WHA3]|uniref:YbjN domain-containing protein n=1 Tax=Pacificimonas pallii TaxID=2827236 RepID=A0ABS6SEC7_9SPHN|nr:YbjN domain-containing protein [Pacificimonas pallii]MBV7256720.1 YbjN domain-containing protein [Pacificimonas pallii]